LCICEPLERNEINQNIDTNLFCDDEKDLTHEQVKEKFKQHVKSHNENNPENTPIIMSAPWNLKTVGFFKWDLVKTKWVSIK
jgi:hypothetical protein